MSIKKNIGKNTIGDNNKMSVDLHTYNMSTHDLSTIFRNTQSAGTLVPNLVLLAQKGDTIDIDIESHVLTHPTVGPLFGSFKHENHIFSVPIRLYNSWLHNNRTKIGLNMSDIKLPQMQVSIVKEIDTPTPEKQWSQVNPSCLLAYLGIRGFGINASTSSNPISVQKMAVPLIGYYDIFKNFYANTQEENFYIIGASSAISKIIVTQTTGQNFESITPDKINIGIANGDAVTIYPANIYEAKDLTITWFNAATQKTNTGKPTDFGTWSKGAGKWTIKMPETTVGVLMSITPNDRVKLKTYPLEDIDTLRDNILTTKGNVTFNVTGNDSIPLLKSFAERLPSKKLNTTSVQYGLCLKTYNSDLLQNWINTEWIDGVTGINEISAVDVTDGKLTMDALNLAQKVYNMLNRIAVSGGTYRDWLETVFTGGNYMERCETPMFEGGMSTEIVFQEVISNSTSGEQPLGTLAGRGYDTGKQKGGHVKIKVTEPCFIMGIGSITPRIDYSQGNEFYNELKTVDDIHKPALDGIGYQDSLNWQRAWWDDTHMENNGRIQSSAGKTVAWVNYMTNINRTFGNFAINDNEAFMVLNRNYELSPNAGTNETKIADLTTYIDPVKFNYIFAYKNLDAMNFWVQTKFDIKVRRLISAKQIPNL
jgi:hypothetical protein